MRVASHNRSKAMSTSSGLAIALTFSTILSSGAARADQSTDNLQAQIDALQKQITQIKAQSASSSSGPSLPSLTSPDGTLTMYGVTLYGTLDVGVSGQTHGSGYNADFVTGVGELLQKNGGGAKWNVTPGGMEQNKIGLKGKEEVMDGLSVVFKVETGFNPVSGVLSSSQKSQLDNNGTTVLNNTTTNGDSSRAGQPFEGAAFAGLSSPTYGTLTFGRHLTPLNEMVTKYDPQMSSYAFSPIEWSGFTQGAGDTEDARYDDSVKYDVAYGPVRFTGIYQFAGNTNAYGGDNAYQADIGFDYGNLSLDALYSLKHDAINTSTINTAAGVGSQLLNATVSDNYAFAVFAKYDWNPVKIMGGYEHITFDNPNSPVWKGATALSGGGYNTLTQNKYTTASVYHVLWTGARWAIQPDLTLAAAYYMYIQDNFSGIDNGVCVATNLSTCSGTEKMASLSLDYQMTKRFDVYGGIMYSRVDNGLYVGSGYLHNNNISPATGIRFKF